MFLISMGAIRLANGFRVGAQPAMAAFVLVLSVHLPSCSSCEPLVTAETARIDLEREIRKNWRRFGLKVPPKEISLLEMPAGELAEQGGWFFKVGIPTDEGRQIFYVVTMGCSRLNISHGPK